MHYYYSAFLTDYRNPPAAFVKNRSLRGIRAKTGSIAPNIPKHCALWACVPAFQFTEAPKYTFFSFQRRLTTSFAPWRRVSAAETHASSLLQLQLEVSRAPGPVHKDTVSHLWQLNTHPRTHFEVGLPNDGKGANAERCVYDKKKQRCHLRRVSSNRRRRRPLAVSLPRATSRPPVPTHARRTAFTFRSPTCRVLANLLATGGVSTKYSGSYYYTSKYELLISAVQKKLNHSNSSCFKYERARGYIFDGITPIRTHLEMSEASDVPGMSSSNAHELTTVKTVSCCASS